MTTVSRAIAIGLMGIFLAGPALADTPLAIAQVKAKGDSSMDVGSFDATGGQLPQGSSGYGDGVSPDVYWTGGPTGTASYVVLMEDAGAAKDGAPMLYWSVFNIPEPVSNIPAKGWDNPPPGVRIGANAGGTTGYLAPKPPSGEAHTYHLEVFSLDTTLSLPDGASGADVIAAMDGHVIASGETTAAFQAP
jgi:Raf kinase inhibitor-like YbhB/YbcL family protein